MRNKKANIPITILVIGTLAICIITLAAFYIIRDNSEKDVSSFNYLRVMYSFQDNLEYSGDSISYIIEDSYNKQSWLGKKLLGYRNYYPFVKDIKIQGGNLSLNKAGIQATIPLNEKV